MVDPLIAATRSLWVVPEILTRDETDVAPSGEGFSPEELTEAERYRLVIQWSDEDGVYLARLPDFDGIMAHGATVEAAAARGVELAAQLIDIRRADGRALPVPASIWTTA